jgi:hypothetical protein
LYFHTSTNKLVSRKKAGATDDTGEGVVSGMTESMRKRAREALAGRTGETDDEDEKDG